MAEAEPAVRVTIDVPQSLWEELKRAAVADLRPIKDELVILLRAALAGRDGERS